MNDFITLTDTAQISSALFIIASLLMVITFRFYQKKDSHTKSSKHNTK